MRRFAFMLLLAAALLSVTSIAAQQEPTPSDATFQWMDSSPSVGEELGAQRELVLYFDRAVNCDSAAAAITIEPAIAGTFSCNADEASVTFTPDGPYEPATTYVVTLDSSLTAEDGAALAGAVTLDFASTGVLAVTEVLPA